MIANNGDKLVFGISVILDDLWFLMRGERAVNIYNNMQAQPILKTGIYCEK